MRRSRQQGIGGRMQAAARPAGTDKIHGGQKITLGGFTVPHKPAILFLIQNKKEQLAKNDRLKLIFVTGYPSGPWNASRQRLHSPPQTRCQGRPPVAGSQLRKPGYSAPAVIRPVLFCPLPVCPEADFFMLSPSRTEKEDLCCK